MGRVLRNDLQHIPVLDDLSFVIETKDIDTRPDLVLVRRPKLTTVKDDEVAFGNGTYDLNGLSGVLAGHAFEVLDERLYAVRNLRIVLRVRVADKPGNCFRRRILN
jgi:hypothetical protein